MADQQPAQPLKGITVPKDIKDRVDRARGGTRKDADVRRQCVKFFQNEPYWYIKARGGLGVLPTALDAVDKQNYRVRKKLNLIPTMVESKVSRTSQRVPGYEIDAATSDQDDKLAANLAERIAFWGWDQWRLRRLTIKIITNALVQREGFAMPYFDPNVGPYRKNETGETVGAGEVKVLSLSRSEVGWEPGMDFEESPYHIIERAVLADEVKKLPGFVGGDLKKDAMMQDLPEGKKSAEMVRLTEYLERPCPDYPDGRRCFIANDKITVNYRQVEPDSEYWWEDYPSHNPDGEVTNDICLHRLSYTVDPEGDDRGLVELLIDPQLTVLDCWNKILELKNRALMLQSFSPRGSNLPRRDDTPGANWEYNPVGGQKPEWEPPPPPEYLNQLIQVLEQAKMEMRAIAADVDVQPDPNLAARTANAAIEQAQAQWQSFLGDLAEFHSRLMRHCLTLVQLHYDEKRLITIRGQYGAEPTIEFRGQDLRSQVNVRVLPGSIESFTRQQLMQDVNFIAGLFPGALQPESVMAAMHGGSFEGLFKSYELHQARAWALVQKIRSDPHSVMNMPVRMDLEIGTVENGFRVPGWMPRKQDNIAIWKDVIATYMISPDFEQQQVDVQFMFDQIWNGLEQQEQMRMMKMEQQSQDAAAQLGQANAAKPQGPIAMPQPQNGLTPEQAAPAAMTPG